MAVAYTFVNPATARLFGKVWDDEQFKHFHGAAPAYVEGSTVEIPAAPRTPTAERFAIATTWFNLTLAAIEKEKNREAIQEATLQAARWLNLGNEAAEKGKHELAERHWARSQKWHDKMIDLSGEGDTGTKRDAAFQKAWEIAEGDDAATPNSNREH